MAFLKSSLRALALLCLSQTIFAQTNAAPVQTSIPLEFNTGNPTPYGGPSHVPSQWASMDISCYDRTESSMKGS